MPIRINLLAEAHAAEEARRKDPVKRAGIIAAGVVAVVAAWAGSLQVRIISSNSELNTLQAKWRGIEKQYESVVAQRRKTMDAEERLLALQQYTTNRFLWGTALNAFQQSIMGVEDVHVTRFKGEQAYVLTDEVKAKPNDPASGKPATSMEKISWLIEAVDACPQPGAQVNRFKQSIASVPYFQNNLQKTNGVLLTALSAPQVGSAARTPYVTFTFQCYFPEKVR